MWLLVAYIGLAIVGNAIVYFVVLLVERVYPIASLPTFLVLFFATLFLAWLGAVKLTAPRGEATS